MDEIPKRKPIRLPNYDYAQNGCYFVTMCTKNKKPLLWKPVGADIIRPRNMHQPAKMRIRDAK